MSILIKPIITEKSMRLVPDGQYTFIVHPDTNKIEITKEIKRLYKVDTKEVRIINAKGKVKTFRRHAGKQSDIKKAIIILKAGQKISGFEMPSDKTDEKDKKKDK